MWLTKKIIADTTNPQIKTGKTISSNSLKYGQIYKNLPIISPWNIIWNPPINEESVITQTDNGYAVCGCIINSDELESGEIKIKSQGGAEIYLKNNGEVIINGQTFAAKGDDK